METKVCLGCKQELPINSFYKVYKRKKRGSRSSNRMGRCRACKQLQKRSYLNSKDGYLRSVYYGIKTRHLFNKDRRIIKQHKCYFSYKEFVNHFTKHEEKYGMHSCLGPNHLPMTMTAKVEGKLGRGTRSNSMYKTGSNMSPDRLDNSKPYTLQNLIFVRTDENTRKNAITITDCREILKLYQQRFVKMQTI